MSPSGIPAGFGAMVLTQLTGIVVDRFSYRPIFVIAGVLPIIATMGIFLLDGRVCRLKGRDNSLSRLEAFQKGA